MGVGIGRVRLGDGGGGLVSVGSSSLLFFFSKLSKEKPKLN